ncbi:MAG: PEP-CTERM sorting domain-containing protein [Sedimentisphaerales bacterium]|nr:PEP-CTERM sorting domain-containing protein [Sedimentisphaerales bacterium]
MAFLAVFCFVSSVVSAHDAGSAEDPIDIVISGWETAEYIHVEDPELEHKGWAFLGIQNSGSDPWGDFHIKLTTSDPLKPVIFVINPPYAPVTNLIIENVYLSEGGTQINFEFYNNPVPQYGLAIFQVYTDNTAYQNSQFTLCMTPTPVPEPVTLGLLAIGAGMVIRRKK